MSKIYDVYKKCYNAKNKYPDSFIDWIHEFLHFAPQKLLQSDLKRFEKIMSSVEAPRFKTLIKLHKYSASQYIFYYMSYETPEKLTNSLHLAEDAESWVKFFNMDFFNIENPKIVLYSFVHALNSACEEIGINYLDISKMIFKLYYELNNFDENIQYGPAKSRFFEYYRQKMGFSPGKNPDRTLIISEDFFNSFDISKKEKLEKILKSDIPLVDSDYQEIINILELKGKKGKRLWTDDKFSIYRSNNRLYIYLVNEIDGKVWKVYSDKTPLKEIIAEYNTLK